MENKKYYWLKLKDNFFDRDEIKIIESLQNGKDYIIFYMKMLMKSVATGGSLRFRDTIPYSPEMLSTLTNTNIDTVKMAVEMFINLRLMEKYDDGTLFMIETQNMLGAESKWAEIKRKQRDKKTEIGHCPTLSKKCPIEKDIEKDIKEEGLSELEEDFIRNQITKSDVNPACLKKYKTTLRTNLKFGDEATCINFKKYVASKSESKSLKTEKKASNTDDFIDCLFAARELKNA